VPILADARSAVPGDWGDPHDWKDEHEAALYAALYAHGNGKAKGLPRIDQWDIATDPQVWWRAPHFDLDYDALRNTPRIAGLANAVTPANTPYEKTFTVDFGNVAARFQTKVEAHLSPEGIVDVTFPSPTKLRATPRTTGEVVVTVTADNGYQVGSSAFWLSVGAATPKTGVASPSPAPTAGLSLRRGSFLFDDTELT
jgi:hypothetical protein